MPSPLPGSEPQSLFQFWYRWVAANALGEFVGLGCVFAMGLAVATRLGEPTTPVALAAVAGLIIISALFEGWVVGFAQWWVLRQRLPHLRGKAWISATIIGALIAWLLGMIPSLFAPEAGSEHTYEPSIYLVTVMVAAMGLVLGVILASAQWWVLRTQVDRAHWWLPANGVAWMVAMPLIFWLVGITIAENQSLAALAILLPGIGVAGAIVGAIHGVVLGRLLLTTNAA